LIVVALTVAVLNEVLERRQRERWSVLAQYALFDLVGAARLVWTGLLELAGLAPEEELEHDLLAAGSEALLDTPRLAAAIDEMFANADSRETSPPPNLALPPPDGADGFHRFVHLIASGRATLQARDPRPGRERSR
jgi:hypothetical protein